MLSPALMVPRADEEPAVRQTSPGARLSDCQLRHELHDAEARVAREGQHQIMRRMGCRRPTVSDQTSSPFFMIGTLQFTQSNDDNFSDPRKVVVT
jgi:hypothetical protein